MMKKLIADKVTGRPLMTVELFLKLMLKYKILNESEAITVFRTGLLPDDIMDRILKIIDETRKN